MKKNKKNSQSCFVNFVNLDFVLSFFFVSMKVSLLLLLLVITCCLIDDSEGWGRRRWRVRIRARRVFKAVCNTVCRIKCCPLCTPVCGRVCGKVCGRKRSEVGTFSYHTIYHHRDSVTLTYLYMYSFDIRIFKVIRFLVTLLLGTRTEMDILI